MGVAGDGGSGPAVDVTDETLVVAAPSQVRSLLCDEQQWETTLPGIRLSCIDDRAELGKRWSVTGVLHGSAEVWLEPWADSVVVHVFLQADPVDGPQRPRAAHRLRERYARAIKRHVLGVKSHVEAGRAPGTPREP